MPEQFKDYTVYGPYVGGDGRSRVILYKDKIRRTMSYPKFLWWKEKGVLISDFEEIHHKDDNYTNNVTDNFEVVNKPLHMALHAKPEEMFICEWCEGAIILSGGLLSRKKSDRKRGKAGPFCSKRCAGKYGAYVMYIVKGNEGQGGRKPYRLKNLANKLYDMRKNNGT